MYITTKIVYFMYFPHIFQWFDDKNVTQIDEDRFNREHCDDTCFKNYAMPGITES